MTAPKQALLVDVDGVLNIPHQGSSLGWEVHDVLGPLDSRTYRLTLNPQHGTWLREQSKIFELVWCTTWWRVAACRSRC